MLNDFAQSLLVILLSLGFTLLPLGYLGLHYLRFQLRQNTESFHCEPPWSNPQPEAAVDTSAPSLERPTVVGFFHPYCNAGGGGERVLWTAIHALQKRHPAVRAVVYTGDTDVDEATILNHAVAHFNIPLDISRIHLVFLTQRHLVSDDRYPYLTLLGQSLGSVALGYEALRAVVPDVFVDTMGYAFTYPLVWHLTGVPVVAYVHYPTISSDMVSKLPTASQLSHLPLPHRLLKLTYTTGKRIYYSLFAKLYGWAGGHASRITVNSTWTKNHIDQLWRSAPTSPDEDSEASIASIEGARVVYPPCDTDAFQSFPIDSRSNTIVSVAQFRPEKNHAQQLRAFALYLRRPTVQPGVRLVVLGSCRNQQDQDRVVKLRTLAEELGVADRVEFVVNASFPELQLRLATALIGLHTMVEEHFGIGIVELMAAGLIPLANNSGGPRMDIVTPVPLDRTEASSLARQPTGIKALDKSLLVNAKPSPVFAPTSLPDRATGFLASTDEEYAACIGYIFDTLSDNQRHQLQERARQAAQDRFSQHQFEEVWCEVMAPYLKPSGLVRRPLHAQKKSDGQ